MWPACRNAGPGVVVRGLPPGVVGRLATTPGSIGWVSMVALLLENSGSADKVVRDPGLDSALEKHQGSSAVRASMLRRRKRTNTAPTTASQTDYAPSANPLNVVRKIGATLAVYEASIRHAADACHTFQLLWHQSDAQLAKRGLSRREVARAVYVKHFSLS
jgi:hypothetical protein